MRPRTLFRSAVVADLLLAYGYVAACYALRFDPDDTLPNALRDWKASELTRPVGPAGAAYLCGGCVVLLAHVGSAGGLFLFWRPARWVGVVVRVALLVLVATFGPVVTPGWDAAISYLDAIVGWWVLAMAFLWPPVRAEFDRAVGIQLSAESSGLGEPVERVIAEPSAPPDRGGSR